MDFKDKNCTNNDVISELIDAQSFNNWSHEDSEDNANILYRLKMNLKYALMNELSEVQRQYILDFFVNQLTIRQISIKHKKSESTVSRTITRARKKLLHVLQYTDPTLLGTDFIARIKF